MNKVDSESLHMTLESLNKTFIRPKFESDILIVKLVHINDIKKQK